MSSYAVAVRGGNITRTATVVLPLLPPYRGEKDLRPWPSLQERIVGRG
jgi:hypothetical protein